MCESLEASGKCHQRKERGEQGKEGRGARARGCKNFPTAGLRICWCSRGKSHGRLWSGMAAVPGSADHSTPYVCCSLSAIPHSWKRTACSNHERCSLLSKPFIHSRTDHSSHRKPLLWGEKEGASLCHFASHFLWLGQSLWSCQRPWSLWLPTEDAAGNPLVLLHHCEDPTLQLLLVPTATLVVAALQIPFSTADVIVVRLQLYLLVIITFFPWCCCW